MSSRKLRVITERYAATVSSLDDDAKDPNEAILPKSTCASLDSDIFIPLLSEKNALMIEFGLPCPSKISILPECQAFWQSLDDEIQRRRLPHQLSIQASRLWW